MATKIRESKTLTNDLLATTQIGLLEVEQRNTVTNSLVANQATSLARTVYIVDCLGSNLRLGTISLNSEQADNSALFLPLHVPLTVSTFCSKVQSAVSNPVYELEKRLLYLSERGRLSSAEFLIGFNNDPFHPYKDRFNLTLKLLRLFERFTPAHITIQTRSPLVVLALPTLKKLGSRVSVTIALETCSEASIARYTPEFPKARERLNAATALRHLGIDVDLQVAPLLPYGDLVTDAEFFARQLAKHGRSIFILPISGCEELPGKASHHLVLESLERDGQDVWLSTDAAVPLLTALRKIAPEKLAFAPKKQQLSQQTELFAA